MRVSSTNISSLCCSPYFWSRYLGILLFFSTLDIPALYAQQDEHAEVNSMLQQASTMLDDNDFEGAEFFSQKALSVAKLRRWSEAEGRSYLILAKTAFRQSKHAEALSYGVQASAKFELTGNTLYKIASYRLLTQVYSRIQTYPRAIAYGQKLEKLYEADSANTVSMADLRYDMSRWHLILQQYEQAETYAYTCLETYQFLRDTPELAEIHEHIVSILQKRQKYEEAIPHALWLANIYAMEKSYERRVASFNTLGFLYKKTGNDKKALEAFEKAANLSQNLSKNASAAILLNLGLANSNLGNDKAAIKYYEQALEQQEREGDILGKAEAYNYLASHYFLSGRQEKALETAEIVNQIALEQQDLYLLSDNYLLIKFIYEKEQHQEKQEEYEQKLLQLEEQIKQREVEELQQLAQVEQMAELHEEEIRMAWDEKEKIALEKERQENHIKLQQQQLSLLKKEKQLQDLALEKQTLESNNAKQTLSILQQRLMAEQQKSNLEELTQAQEIQQFTIREQQLTQQKQQQTIELLEKDKRLKQERIKREATLRKYSLGIVVLCLVIILVIAFFFVQKSKHNRILRQQKEEIGNKNELLRQNEIQLRDHLDYLVKARQMLSEQKEQLMTVHNRVQQSIEYAKHIQTSILPDGDFLKSLFPDSCLIFMPKDVVSGDFYWVSEHGDFKIIIVADCTGHGVPGALITLIGHSLLTEAIQVQQMTEPDSILHFLHQRFIDRFQSQDSTRRHGMDLGICVLRQSGNRYQLSFAGAKNNLSIISHGKLSKFKGDRNSVGGSRPGIDFTNHQVELLAGDAFYLSSDGFIDQPNSHRKRLGSGKLAQHIQEWHELPMDQQEQKLTEAFLAHKQDAELRDDVTLLGIRL